MGIFTLVHNNLENQPGKEKVSHRTGVEGGAGLKRPTSSQTPLGGAENNAVGGQVLPGWEEGWTKFQSSTYFNCQETDLLRLSLRLN